jgi:hypothetical protein
MAAVAALVVASLAACGDDGDVDPEADQAAAEAAIEALEEQLQEDGFESAPDDEDDDSDIEFESEECQEFGEAFPEDDEELPGETASEEAEFERGELDPDGGTEESVSAGVGLVEEDGDLDEIFELYGDERLPGCLEEAMQVEFENQAAESGDEDIQVEVNDLRVEEQQLEDVGDETASFAVDATLSAAGFEFPFHIEFAVARSGRSAATLVLSTIGDDESSLDSAELLTVMLDEVAEE